ncbi:glutamate receptor ionotropic, NMDA 2B-like [Elysia marginata]|uniref:Glutamate receptor ionotropic, NMDA 2B-like n=1 Tax=Elysia marginata TaxID=1093978 RepID=A0AAV4GYJ2_9GAST|nr:glutamate receptor ionotropic, NMDA 2B-like [Elysia marginata]
MYMKRNPQTDVKTAIKRLKQNKIQAFIYDSTTLEYEVGKDDGCKLKTVGKRISETGYGIAFPKKSQWTQQVNKALLWLQQDGEIERLQKFWLAGACHKKKETGVSSHTLGILNFTSAFVLLGVGVGLGIILLIMEHCYFRFGRKSLKKWDKCGCCSLVSLSMGQSLTFEQSVMEAIDFHRHHKCKDPLCETQLWKVKHELDLALLKVGQLRKQLAHSSALEASSEDMRAQDRSEEVTSSPYQNGTAARRRRRQTAGDETGVKGQDGAADTRRPLLALEGGLKSDTESDDDHPSSVSSPRRHHVTRTPTSADVEFAPSSRSGGRKGGSLKGSGQKALPDDRGAKSTQQPGVAVSESPSPTTQGSAGSSRGSRLLDGEDGQFASYPPPPPFEEVLASEDYNTYPRPPSGGPNGEPDSSTLRSPSITPPPPPHVPPSADLYSQDSGGGQGSGYFPPPPPPHSSYQRPETQGQQQDDTSPYSLVHKQPSSDPRGRPSPANTGPSSKSSQPPNKTNEMPLTSSSIEDDNDRSLRRQRTNDGNTYVNQFLKVLSPETFRSLLCGIHLVLNQLYGSFVAQEVTTQTTVANLQPPLGSLGQLQSSLLALYFAHGLGLNCLVYPHEFYVARPRCEVARPASLLSCPFTVSAKIDTICPLGLPVLFLQLPVGLLLKLVVGGGVVVVVVVVEVAVVVVVVVELYW